MLIPERITQKYAQIYPSAFKMAKDFRANKGSASLEDWEDWCYLPLAASYAIASNEAAKQNVPANVFAIDIGNLGAILSWRIGKGVYQFDSELLESLWTTPLDGDIPSELLYQLPEWCCYIDLKGFDKSPCDGFFVYLEDDMNTHDHELRLSMVFDGEFLYTVPIHIRKSGIAAGLKETMMTSIANMPQNRLGEAEKAEMTSDDFMRSWAKGLEPMVSVVLYLCASNAEIHCYKHPEKKPERPRETQTKRGNKIFPASTPTEYRIGSQIGAAIRRYRAESAAAGDAAKTISPHIRRAHFHAYRTG